MIFPASFEQYQQIRRNSITDNHTFWAEVAAGFEWQQQWTAIQSGSFSEGNIRWFEGASCNLSANCIDRHLMDKGAAVAIIWEPNDPTQVAREISYNDLHANVCRVANALLKIGIRKGDSVGIYMPMIPEAAFAMLACARIGAVHSVIFAGFSANALAGRLNDAGCKLLITADAFYRGDKKVALKKLANEALDDCPAVKHCVVYNHSNTDVDRNANRDIDWKEWVAASSTDCEPSIQNAEDPLFILYTSGSTGKPKGLLHTTGGYMVYAGYTYELIFRSLFERDRQAVHFCTADIGWVTGHSYGIYGPLLKGDATVLFEGIPTYPDHGRFWDIIDKYSVEIFYTAPTAIRSLQAFGNKIFKGKSLQSLKVIGTVGEPINEEAWHWYNENVAQKNSPITDTWWQTETGGILIAPVAGVGPAIPTFAMLPLPGIEAVLLDEQGNEIGMTECEGTLCIKQPWPGIARTVFGDHERYMQTYFAAFPDYYFTGDGARRDSDGNYRITGRIDDVINISGHRIGTGEVEDAINHHSSVVESAVAGYAHAIKGQGLYAFVIIREAGDNNITAEIAKVVAEKIGAFAKPDKIQVVKALPKTRSGKIMRRILRKIAEGETSGFGDLSTLLDISVIDQIVAGKL